MAKLIDFLNGKVNVMSSFTEDGHEISILRENSKGNILITVSLDSMPIAQQWNPNKLASRLLKKQRILDMNDSCFQTGGQKPFLSVYDNWASDVSVDALGFLFKLLRNIRYKDGLLVDRRTKLPIIITHMVKISGKSRPFVIKCLKELKEKNIIVRKEKCYYVSPEFILRGNA